MIRRAKLLASMRGAGSGSSLPAGFTELEYLVGTGEQYINTGLKCNQDSVLAAKYYATSGCVFGNLTTATKKVVLARITSPIFQIYFGSSYIYIYQLASYVATAPELMVISKDGMELNDVHYDMTNSAGEFESDELYLFASPPYMDSCSATLYYASATIDGVEHIFLPMLDSDGVPCMYNSATGVCHYNAGSGEFGYGLKS